MCVSNCPSVPMVVLVIGATAAWPFTSSSSAPHPTTNYGRANSDPLMAAAQEAAPPETPNKSKDDLGAESAWTTLHRQRLATRKAKAIHEITKLRIDLAQIALDEYIRVKYPTDLALVDAEIKRAERDLRTANDALNLSKVSVDKNSIPSTVKDSAERAAKKAAYVLDQTRRNRSELMDRERLRNVNKLEIELSRTRNDESLARTAWQIQEAREFKLERVLQLEPNQVGLGKEKIGLP
jgi:hypothetical protein